jgi:DNA/RNA endonuclease YhcR with UshA esterase domain
MSNETNAQADLLAATANIGNAGADTSATAQAEVATGTATDTGTAPAKKTRVVLTGAAKAAALRAKAAELIAQAESIESGAATETKFKDIARGWNAKIKVGRGDTRREVTGKVAFVYVEEGNTYVKVLVSKEDGDIDVFKVRITEVVEASAPVAA